MIGDSEGVDGSGSGKGKVLGGACCGCLLIPVVFLIFVGFMLSKTGLIFSGDGFSVPKPVRIVEVGDKSSAEIQADFVRGFSADVVNGDVELALDEGMLTAFLRDALKDGSDNSDVDIALAQVAVLDSGELEFYMPIVTDDKKSAVILLFVPRLTDDGVLKMDVVDSRLGNLHIPGIVTSIPENMLNNMFNDQISELGESVELKSVEVKNGAVVLGGSIPISSLN